MLSALLRSLRPAQWVKNLFVLVPLVFAHRLDRVDLALRSAAAFAAFCAAASAIYLLNDLRDREADRLHPVKRLRPIAAGLLGAPAALAAAVLLAAAALAVAWRLGPGFSTCLGIYLVLNVLYSLGLKRLVIVDVMTIALGFVLRVEAGALAIGVEVSSWLLLCTIFVALFLGFAKRRHELALQPVSGTSTRAVLEHYNLTFVDQMINVVTASTVVSYALYAVDPGTAARLGTPYLVATVPLALFGIFRFLFLLYQKSDIASPTEAILHDPPFLINLALWGVTVLVLIYGT
ncbi:MAG: decaprenyl-phosphate phosphoribosyltransferase [Thermoanaerobaculia bacterium]|nr:decaprenyl-phosphate phosphoribosyltransferase [Thermoanaerobaculia bacterium]